jgi:hypothetical protein
MVDGYTAVYNTAQAGWAVQDVIGGLFDGIAGMSTVLGIGIVALVILGIIAGFITKVSSLA